MPPLVSIIIPAFNSEKYLGETVRSALAQTWPNKEIIIVDDGSSDGTLAIAKQFESHDVKVLTQENRGAAAARNTGLAVAQGDYMQWLDADDLLAPDKISRQFAGELIDDPSFVHTCRYARFHSRPRAARNVTNALCRDLDARGWLFTALETGDWLATATWLVSRRLTDLAGPWNERLTPGVNDDGEYFCRVVSFSNGVKFHEDAMVYYRIGNSNSLSQERSSQALESIYLSASESVNHLLRLDKGESAREAGVLFLQYCVDQYRINDSQVWQAFRGRAKTLDGDLRLPYQTGQFRVARTLLGEKFAGRAKHAFGQAKWTASFQRERLWTFLVRPVVRADQAGEKVKARDRHFQTDHLLTNLESHTISSSYVTIASQATKFCLNLASIMVLARLLRPHDFGLLGMVASTTGFLQVFNRDSGFFTATVQRDRITHAQVSNLFWLNTSIGACLTALMAASAPLVAWFFHEPRLFGITLVLSAVFLLNGSRIQHQALLDRQMRFKAIALIEIGSMFTGVVAGITMALWGFGYWSLVGLNLTTEVAGLLLVWIVSRWRPQLPKRNSGTWALVKLGAKITVGSALNVIARSVDSLLIGRRYGPASLGLYTRGMALLTRPLEQILAPVGAVFVPSLSRLQNDRERYRRVFLQIYEIMALFSCMFASMIFALAHPLTLVLLGKGWEQTASILSGLAIAALFLPVIAAAGWLFLSQGRGKDYIVLNSISAIITIASFVGGLPFGAVGVAYSFSISGLVIRLPITYWLAGRRGPVGTGDLWNGFLKCLPICGIVSVAVWLVRLPIPDDQAIKELLFAGPCGVLAAVAFLSIYPPTRQMALRMGRALKGGGGSGWNFRAPFLSLFSMSKNEPTSDPNEHERV